MLFRDDYLKMLEKRASDFDGGKTGPTYDHDVNSAEQGTAEHKKNLGENREYLGGLFKNMGEATRVETASAKSGVAHQAPGRDLLAAAQGGDGDALRSSAFQGYPLHYKMAAVRGFVDELEKISAR